MKNNFKFLFACLLLGSGVTYAQVGVGTTTPDASSMLEITSTTKGFLMPRMTTAERTAIATPATGLQVYDTTTNSYWYYNGTAWTVNSDEWTYNGTDAIQATRALANNNTISVTDSGKLYNNIGSFDWTTQLSPNGLNVAWTVDPKGTYPITNLITSSSLPTTSPNWTSSGYGRYTFGLNHFIVNENHVAAATGASKNYFGSNDFLELHGVTSPVTLVVGSSNPIQIASTTSSNIGSVIGSQDLAYHFGTGAVSLLTGHNAIASRNGTGNANTMYAYNGNVMTAATSSSNTTSMFAANLSSAHSSPGTMVNLRGVFSSTSIAGTASIPSYTTGILSTVANTSSTVNGAAADLIALQAVATNSGAAKFTNLQGFNVSATNAAAAGAFTTGYGISNGFTNSATTTDPIATLYGYTSAINQNGNSPIANMSGIWLTTQTNNTAVAIPNNLYGISMATNLRTTTTGTANNLIGILNNTSNSSAVNSTAVNGLNQTTSVTGAGFATSSIYGIRSNVSNASIGTGTTPIYYGFLNQVTNSSTTNTVTDLRGNQTLLTNTGKVTNILAGFMSQYTNNSTQGNTISSAYGIYSNVATSNLSNDNVLNNFGLFNYNTFASTGLSTNLYGGYFYNTNQSTNSGVVSIQTGIHSYNEVARANSITNNYGANIINSIQGTATGTIANNFGVKINNNIVSGTSAIVTNNYGLYLDQVAGGVTKNFSIYSDGGDVYFKDNVGIGTTTPTSKLQVVGLPVHVDNAAAVTAGLTAGAFYHSGDGIVRVVY